MVDRTQVLKASTSLLDVLGVSEESKAWVQKQMAALLGVQDPNFYKEVEALWHEAYRRKVEFDKYTRDVFAAEAIVNGLKYVKDERYEDESKKLSKLREIKKEAERIYITAVDKAKAAQEEYLAGRSKS